MARGQQRKAPEWPPLCSCELIASADLPPTPHCATRSSQRRISIPGWRGSASGVTLGQPYLTEVRSTPKSRHSATIPKCPFGAAANTGIRVYPKIEGKHQTAVGCQRHGPACGELWSGRRAVQAHQRRTARSNQSGWYSRFDRYQIASWNGRDGGRRAHPVWREGGVSNSSSPR
jgi:hypothetical protein